jgi:hypothetical protein
MEPNECCFVGDHPTIDVAGAEAAGLRGIRKRTPYWHRPCVLRPSIPSQRFLGSLRVEEGHNNRLLTAAAMTSVASVGLVSEVDAENAAASTELIATH